MHLISTAGPTRTDVTFSLTHNTLTFSRVFGGELHTIDMRLPKNETLTHFANTVDKIVNFDNATFRVLAESSHN